MSCFVFVVNRRLFSEFFKLVSTYCAALTCEGLFCSYVVICTDVFGLRWCIFGCVSLLCFIHVYFLLSGAAAVMELSRGEVPLYVSLTEQSSFFPHVSFSCSSCSLFFLMSCFSWFNLWNSILSLFLLDLSFHSLWLYMYICLCLRENYSRNYFGHPSFCILWTASLITAFTFGL